MSEQPLERRVRGERLFTGRVVALEVDTVTLTNGRERVREVVRHRGAAVVLPILDDGRVLLVRQYRYPIARCLWELPAGKLEADEEPLACARRELTEETGWVAEQWQSLGTFFTTPGFSDEQLHCFLATALRQSDTPTDGEIVELAHLTLDQLQEMAQSGEICDSKTMTALYLARAHGCC